MDNKLYFDNAATTRPYPEAVQAGMPFLTNRWGNPSSSYSLGTDARYAIYDARCTIAKTLGAEPDQIFFTSGATESNNTVIQSVGGTKIITTPIEHHAILRPSERGFWTIYLPIDNCGRVKLKEAEKVIKRTSDAHLVSVMAANNEIGTVEPIKELAEIAHKHGKLFHTDATQYYGHQILNVNSVQADFISASAHKFGGIKGTGFLFVRKGTEWNSFLKGGHQENGHRAGTENVFGIIVMANAAKLSCEKISEESARLVQLRSYLITRVLNEIEGSFLTGDEIYRLPNNASFVFSGIRGEELIELLNVYNIAASSGSACETGSEAPSHVLKAIGLSDELANGSLRLTMGRDTTKDAIDYTIDKLKKSIDILRSK